MSKSKPKPTESELQILQVLWERGPSSVRAINEVLNEQRPVGYTTTLKLMQLMLEKGLLERDASSRTHIYRAGVEESATQKDLLKRFVDTTFRGSALKMVMQALGNSNTSAEELEEIRNYIEDLEKKKP